MDFYGKALEVLKEYLRPLWDDSPSRWFRFALAVLGGLIVAWYGIRVPSLPNSKPLEESTYELCSLAAGSYAQQPQTVVGRIGKLLPALAKPRVQDCAKRSTAGHGGATARLANAQNKCGSGSAVSTGSASETGESQVTLVLRPGANVDIFLSRTIFETTTYPERVSSIQKVGNEWCGSVHWWEMLAALPAVRVRDVASGDTLAQYDCFLGRTSVGGKASGVGAS
jgi:hypothetical protein